MLKFCVLNLFKLNICNRVIRFKTRLTMSLPSELVQLSWYCLGSQNTNKADS